jgi:hypothetical protein
VIDENDYGELLAKRVALEVIARYPTVVVEFLPWVSGRWFTIATFTPPNSGGVIVSLVANSDWSFDLQVGRFHVFDMEPMTGTEDDQASRIVEAISELARDGLTRTWLDRLIGGGKERVAGWLPGVP